MQERLQDSPFLARAVQRDSQANAECALRESGTKRAIAASDTGASNAGAHPLPSNKKGPGVIPEPPTMSARAAGHS